MNIVCTIDERYAQHCGVMLRSLFANNPGVRLRVFVFTDGITRSSHEKLEAVAAASRQQIECRTIDPVDLRDAPVNGHVSLATYFRILAPRLLPPDLDRALFLDSDLIVRGALKAFYEQPLRDDAVAAVANPFGRGEMRRLGIPVDAGYFNAGVLLMNLPIWRREDISRQLLDCLASDRDRLVWWDQDALNLTLQGRWRASRPTWNAQEAFFKAHTLADLGVTAEELHEAKTMPRIVHFAGSGKPWHYGYEHPFKHEYYRYLADTPWRGARPVGRPSFRVRAIRMAGRCAPRVVRQGYRKLATTFRPA